MRALFTAPFLLGFLAAGCITSDLDDSVPPVDPEQDEEILAQKELARQTDGVDDDGTDLCAEEGWYGDGVCDDFCPEPDPDCADLSTCRKTGCSGHVCADEDIYTTCEWHESYACYADAICARQSDGQCGWTMTDELEACLSTSL